MSLKGERGGEEASAGVLAPRVEHGVLGGAEAQQVPHLVAELGEVLPQVVEVLHRGLVSALHLLPRGRQVAMHQATHDLLVVLVALLFQVFPLLFLSAERAKKLRERKEKGTCNLFFWFPLSHLQAVLPFHPAFGRVRADPLAHAGHQVADGLGGRDDVERRGQRALVVKVAQPQFGAGKLPLLVLVILQKPQTTKMWRKLSKLQICTYTSTTARLSDSVLFLKTTASKVNKERNNLTSGEHLRRN